MKYLFFVGLLFLSFAQATVHIDVNLTMHKRIHIVGDIEENEHIVYVVDDMITLEGDILSMNDEYVTMQCKIIDTSDAQDPKIISEPVLITKWNEAAIISLSEKKDGIKNQLKFSITLSR